MIGKILYILSVIENIAFFMIMRIELYTDRYHLPDGEMGENKRSPLDSLYHADQSWLAKLEFVFMLVSIVTSVLMFFGVKNNIVKTVQIVATAASTIGFIIIMIYAGNVHLKY